jgi:hypothetical protein
MGFLRTTHRKRLAKRISWIFGPGMSQTTVECLAKRFADNRAKCSCPMCGNMRRHFGLETIQERREKQKGGD